MQDNNQGNTYQDDNQSGSTAGQTPYNQGQTNSSQINPSTGAGTAQPISDQSGASRTLVEEEKEDTPKLSQEEIDKFDMRDFDPSLKPDLSQMSDDSLGKALGGQAGKYSGQQMTAAQQYDSILNAVIPPHQLTLDEKKFKELLAGSISLMYEEKMAILEQIPRLKQQQVDELFKILNEEKKRFAELNKKHQDELKKLEDKHENKEEKEKLEMAEMQSKQSDEEAAAEILRQLQGGE